MSQYPSQSAATSLKAAFAPLVRGQQSGGTGQQQQQQQQWMGHPPGADANRNAFVDPQRQESAGHPMMASNASQTQLPLPPPRSSLSHSPGYQQQQQQPQHWYHGQQNTVLQHGDISQVVATSQQPHLMEGQPPPPQQQQPQWVSHLLKQSHSCQGHQEPQGPSSRPMPASQVPGSSTQYSQGQSVPPFYEQQPPPQQREQQQRVEQLWQRAQLQQRQRRMGEDGQQLPQYSSDGKAQQQGGQQGHNITPSDPVSRLVKELEKRNLQRSNATTGAGAGAVASPAPLQVPLPRHQQPYRQQHRQQPHQQQSKLKPKPKPSTRKSLLTDESPEATAILAELKEWYRYQDDPDACMGAASPQLREQRATAAGTIGTVDVQRCMQLISDNDITFIVTDTGTGKSTLIPKALLEADESFMVVNAQPRRISAITLAQRVAKLRNETLGDKVGFSVRGERAGELGLTRLMYVSNYSLFLHLLWHAPNSVPFTHVILDEIHERTSEVQVILLLMKVMMRHSPGKLKLILCSATTEVELWRTFFEGFSIGEYSQANVMYPVHEYYAEEIGQLVGHKYCPPNVGKNGIVSSLALQHITHMIHKTLRFLASFAAPQHSVMVFLPGRTPVEKLCQWVRENLAEQFYPVVWYSDVDLSVIKAELERDTGVRKKVYIATSIAEVSITLPDVVFVIDSGTAKLPRIDERNPLSVAFPPLQLLWEGRTCATQRRGRIGRVQQGFYLSMLGRKHAMNMGPSENRIANDVLHSLLLHVLQLTSTPFVTFRMCHEWARNVSVNYSILTLRDGGFILAKDDALSTAEAVSNEREGITGHLDWDDAINAYAAEAKERKRLLACPAEDDKVINALQDEGDAQLLELSRHSFQVTAKGLIVSHAPVGIEAGSTVFFGILFGIPTLGIITAAVEACKSPFVLPYGITERKEKQSEFERVSAEIRKYKGGLRSDIVSFVGAVLEYMDMQKDGLSEEAQKVWCESRSLSRTRLVDIVNLVAQMKEQVGAICQFHDIRDVDVLKNQYDENAEVLMIVALAGHLQSAIFIQNDPADAQRKRFSGSGVFIPMKCLQSMFVPSTCPWNAGQICVPFSLQTTYEMLLACFATEISTELLNILLLLFTYSVFYDVSDSGRYLFGVSYIGVNQSFECDNQTAMYVLQLRRMQCAALAILQLQVEGRVSVSDIDKMAAHLESLNCDFGIPDEVKSRPDCIPLLLQKGLKTLVARFRGKVEGAMCAVKKPRPVSEFRYQSLLIRSSNGVGVNPAAVATGHHQNNSDQNAMNDESDGEETQMRFAFE